MKRQYLHFFFAVIIVATFLIGLEVVVRFTHLWGAACSWSEPDPLLGYRYVAGSRFWVKGENGTPNRGRINRYGFRGEDWAIQKPQGIYRIAVLGDSFVEAFPIPTERTFLYLTERQFNLLRCPYKLELMNFGRAGYTQTEEFIVLQRDVIRFSPDMVILCFYPGNDIDDISKETAPELDRPFYQVTGDGQLRLDTSFTNAKRYKLRCLINKFKQHSALISLIGDRYNMFERLRRTQQKQSEQKSTAPPGSITGHYSLCTAHPLPSALRSYQLNKLIIKAMAEFCRTRGIAFMLVVLYEETYLPSYEEELKRVDATFDPYFFEDDLKTFAEELGLHFLGLQRVFRNHYTATGHRLHWVHMNYEGHEVAAQALVTALDTILCR